MWLERQRESEGLKRLNNSQSSHCAVRLPGHVCFLREEEAVQINRQHSQDFPPPGSQLWSLPLCHSLSLSAVQQSRISLWDGLRFSLQCCLFACLGQPTYVAHSRRRVNSPILLPPFSVCSSFSYTFSFIPKTVLWWLIYPSVLALCVWNYFCMGSCVWLLCRDPSSYKGSPVLRPPAL